MRAKWPGWDCELRDDPPPLPAHVDKLVWSSCAAATEPAGAAGGAWDSRHRLIQVRALPPLSLSAVSTAAGSDERWPATVALPAG